MSNSFIIALPEISLILSLPILYLVNALRENKTPKTFFTLSKIFILISLAGTIIFYNRSYFPEMFYNSRFTTLFKLVIYILAIGWFYLSLKWFLTKNVSSFKFYLLCNMSILFLCLSISASNLLALFITLEIALFINYLLIRVSDVIISEDTVRKYFMCMLMFTLIFASGVALFYLEVGSFHYGAIFGHLHSQNLNLLTMTAIILVLAALLYMIGVAPFHFWFANTIGECILPVSGYLSIIPVFAYFFCLVNIVGNALLPAYGTIKEIFMIFGVLSVILGSVCANREKNLRKLFAYGMLFHLGIIFITLSGFNKEAALDAFVYLITCILAIAGTYAVFYGFKAKGEYLRDLDSISGIFKQKPYISAAFLIFMFSQIGCPPMLGFLGRFSIMNNLIAGEHYVLIAVIFFAMILLADAYLRVIKVVYFSECNIRFDRTDKGIYIFLGINILIVLFSILHPRYLIHGFEQLFASAL